MDMFLIASFYLDSPEINLICYRDHADFRCSVRVLSFMVYSRVRIRGTMDKRNFLLRGTFVPVPFLVLLCPY